MIQDIIFRVISSIYFLFILPLLLYILLVYPCLPDAVPHLSTVVGPNNHPPVLSIALLPHATLFSTELHCLQVFKVKSSQVKYRLLHGRLEKIGEASAATAATEAYYRRGIIIWKKKRLK